ncbi:MAG: ISAzo13-like element transposase-related protein, partial [Gammaproteobacteria bacterium]
SREYEAGVKITDQDMDRVNLRPHRTHPQWNYTIAPQHFIT